MIWFENIQNVLWPPFHFQIDIRTKEALAPSVSIIKAWGIAPMPLS